MSSAKPQGGKIENSACATADEVVNLEVPQCHPGQVWAADKNPRCSFTYNDAVYQHSEATCNSEVRYFKHTHRSNDQFGSHVT